MKSGRASFVSLIKHPFKFRIFLLKNLPSAYFSGVRITAIDAKSCSVVVPYKWMSRNPFRSTYFACLSMAAEMSTGALAMSHIYQRNPPISMLVVKVESEYFKKATGVTTFTCHDGNEMLKAIEESIVDGEAKTFCCTSTGVNASGEIIAVFKITWSFKAKTKREIKSV